MRPRHPLLAARLRRAARELAVFGGLAALAAGVSVRAQAPGLKHEWEPKHDLRAPRLKVGKPPRTPLATGELISLELLGGGDGDRDLKTGWRPKNDVYPTHWSDSGAGGTFGEVVNGQFAEASHPQRVTHYRVAPNPPASIKLAVTVDDEARAVDPKDGEVVSTFNDQAVTTGAMVGTFEFSHTHTWERPPAPRPWKSPRSTWSGSCRGSATGSGPGAAGPAPGARTPSPRPPRCRRLSSRLSSLAPSIR